MNPADHLSHDIYLQLPILIVVVSLVYSATRFDGWVNILIEAVRWGLRMTTFLLFFAVILYVLAICN